MVADGPKLDEPDTDESVSMRVEAAVVAVVADRPELDGPDTDESVSMGVGAAVVAVVADGPELDGPDTDGSVSTGVEGAVVDGSSMGESALRVGDSRRWRFTLIGMLFVLSFDNRRRRRPWFWSWTCSLTIWRCIASPSTDLISTMTILLILEI